MEIWLKDGNNAFRFPVLPPEFTIEDSSVISNININNIGEVAIFGGKKGTKTAISTFFPKQAYQFVEYSGFMPPYDCVAKIKAWKEAGKVLRFVITGVVNIPVYIETFTYGEKDGSGDVYFTLTFVEHIELKITKIKNVVNEPTPPKRPVQTAPKKRTHKVVKGDTLWALASRYYGNGSKYPTIHNANKDKVKNPNLIHIGWVLVIP